MLYQKVKPLCLQHLCSRNLKTGNEHICHQKTKTVLKKLRKNQGGIPVKTDTNLGNQNKQAEDPAKKSSDTGLNLGGWQLAK